RRVRHAWSARRTSLFPYTTLFRSRQEIGGGQQHLAARLTDCPQQRAQDVAVLAGGRVGQSPQTFAPGRRRRQAGRLQGIDGAPRSEEHTSELQSRENLVCRLLLEK